MAVQFIRRAPDLGFGINDYALRLASTETEKAQIEESLLASRKLEEWNRMSAVVTHEINNPLAAIQNLMFLIEISPGVTPEIVADGAAIGRRGAPDRVADALHAGILPAVQAPEKVDLLSSAESVRVLLER